MGRSGGQVEGASPSARGRIWMLTSVHPGLDARIFYREARSAAERGYDVTVLAPGATGGRVDGVSVRTLRGPGGRAGRLVRWPILFVAALRGRADVYQVHDPELLPWAWLLRLLTRRAVVYDAHEFFPEAILTKQWIPRTIRASVSVLAGWLEKALAGRLSAVIGATPELADRFAAVNRLTVTVMNLPPLLEAGDADEPSGRAVIYAGLMNHERGLDILFATAGLVHARFPDFELRVLGRVDPSGLPQEAARTPEAWAAAGVRFLGSVTQPQVASHLRRSAIGWLPMNPGSPGKRLAWPVKMGEYLAAGIPIVASDLPVQSRVIREASAGIVVGPFTAEAHAEAIMALLEQPALAAEMGRRGRDYARAHLSWESQADVLVRLYDGLIAGQRGPAADRGPGRGR